jgi:GGDEF domain-containing protein
LATSPSTRTTRARRFALPDLEDARTHEAIEAFLEGPKVRRRRRGPASVAAEAEASAEAESLAESAAAGAEAAAGSQVAAGVAGASAGTGIPEPAETGAGSRAPAARSLPAVIPAAPRPPTDLRTLPGRLEWNAALDRESKRAARYGRPAAVAIVELKSERPNQSVDPWLRTIAGPIARVLREDSRATDLVARVASTRFQMLLPETSESGAECLAERIASGCRTYIESTAAPITVHITVAASGLADSLHDAVAHALRSIEAA